MKRLFTYRSVCILLILLVIGPTPNLAQTNVSGQSVPTAPIVILNDTKMSFDVDPIIIEGSTLVPMRAIFEALGATITNWDAPNKTVYAQRNQTEFKYTIGDSYAIINGWKVDTTGAPGITKDNRTLVPLRMVSESLGAKVNYDSKTRTITIKYDQTLPNKEETAASLMRYRMTLPYSSMLQDAPYQISYLRHNVTKDSYIFFGDSLTWGSYLGRQETHSYLLRAATGKSSYNLGVPGFTMNQIVPLMEYSLQDVVSSNVVVQLQYFWGQSSIEQYRGLSELIEGSVPSLSDSLYYIRNDMIHDDDHTRTRPYASYNEQPTFLRDAIIERGKQLFTTKTILDEKLSSKLNELSAFVATRPDINFYVYIPPYQLSEVLEHTMLTRSQFDDYISQIKSVFVDSPNVQFKDFNTSADQWTSTDYIDWIHRSVSGEQKFAKLMQQWLVDGQ